MSARQQPRQRLVLEDLSAPAGSARASSTGAVPGTWPVEVADVGGLVRGVRRGSPPWARAAGLLRGAGSSGAGGEDAEVVDRLRRPVTTCRRIAVGGVRGGGGRTTTSLLLAAVLAARRLDGVVLVDDDVPLGSLGWRLPVPPTATRTPDGAPVDRLPGGLDVVTAGRVAAAGGAAAALEPLTRSHAVAVLDRAGVTGLDAPADLLREAHAGVLVVPATPDGVRAALTALRRVAVLEGARSRAPGERRRPELPPDPTSTAARTVVALVSRSRQGEALDVRAALRALRRPGGAAVHVPFDRHLASGAAVDAGRTHERTQAAAAAVAAEALARSAGVALPRPA